MFRNLIALFVATCCVVLVGCGDNHEKVAQDYVVQMKKVVSVLEDIETVEDAKSAKSQLKNISNELRSIDARMKRLGKPNADQDMKLKAKFSQQQKEFAPKITALMEGFSQEIRDELERDVKNVSNAKDKASSTTKSNDAKSNDAKAEEANANDAKSGEGKSGEGEAK